MTHTILSIVLLFVATGFGETTAARKPSGCSFFTTSNASRLLGGAVKAEEGKYFEKDQEQRWSCTFALAEPVGERSPKLHFILIRHKSESAAIDDIASIKRSNENLAGFEMLSGIGDEALVHTDGENFQLVVVRKGANSFRLKLNPMTGVNVDTVKAIALELAATLK